VSDLTPYLEDKEDGDDLRANHIQEGVDEANVLATQVQVNSQILLSAQRLQQRGLGPCTNLELQLHPHPKPLNVLLCYFGMVKRPSK